FFFQLTFFVSGYILGSRKFLRSERHLLLFIYTRFCLQFFFFPFQVLIIVLKKLAIYAIDLKTVWGDYKKKYLCKCPFFFFFFFFFFSVLVFFSPCTCLTFDFLFHLFPFLDKKKIACQESCFAISNTM
ncbi:unnamed protein product, partial [Ixodes pacificus]